MPIVAADWSITRSTGAIRYIGASHTGAATYATVIELHRWLGSLSDDSASAGDDELAMSDLLPSSRSTDNIIKLLGIYNIDAVTAEHLYDGSIIQGSAGIDQVIYDGIVNFGNADVQIQVIQNGAVIPLDFWNQAGLGLNADAAQGISHRFMIKTHDFVAHGGDIDGRRLVGTARRFNKTYSEFKINGTSRGNNVLALKDADDLNNLTASGVVSGWSSITNTEGFSQLDVDNNGVLENYYSNWTLGTQSINDFYERLKWLTREASASTLYGLNGELFRGVTHEVNVGTPTGTFNAFEAVSWSTGTGQMLAIDSVTAGTKMWMQLLTGVAPTTEVITGGTSAATVTAVSSIDRSALISTPFVGASTGTAIVSSYGLGILPSDLNATDKLFDLSNIVVVPPNNVVFTVKGLVAAEDYIFVAPWDGVATDVEGNPAVDKAQLSLSVSLVGVAETAAVMTAAIPSDTPPSGTLRITTNSGIDRIVIYTSYTGSTFTIQSTDFSVDSATAGNNSYITYIDKLATAASESFSGVYLADRSIVVISRDGGITPTKQFISSAVLGSTGGTITTIRTSDT